jgi:hypothetical protein
MLVRKRFAASKAANQCALLVPVGWEEMANQPVASMADPLLAQHLLLRQEGEANQMLHPLL